MVCIIWDLHVHVERIYFCLYPSLTLGKTQDIWGIHHSSQILSLSVLILLLNIHLGYNAGDWNFCKVILRKEMLNRATIVLRQQTKTHFSNKCLPVVKQSPTCINLTMLCLSRQAMCIPFCTCQHQQKQGRTSNTRAHYIYGHRWNNYARIINFKLKCV